MPVKKTVSRRHEATKSLNQKTVKKAAKKAAGFIPKCEHGLSTGEMTDDTLRCVLAAADIDTAQGCMRR